jgi:hypothetical protein
VHPRVSAAKVLGVLLNRGRNRRQQLGRKLQPGKQNPGVIVVDRIEPMPSEN